MRGAGRWPPRASRRTGERMLLIGDAAGFIDSIAADGLSMAFNSALVLGEHLPAILAGGRDGREPRGLRARRARLFRNYRLVTNGSLVDRPPPAAARRLVRYLSRHPAGRAMMSGAMR